MFGVVMLYSLSIQDSRFGTTSSYFGSACECDNSRCDTTNGQLCGGTNQGVCQCGGCQCLGSYYGSACQCSNSLCVDPNDSQVEMGCEEEGEEGMRRGRGSINLILLLFYV